MRVSVFVCARAQLRVCGCAGARVDADDCVPVREYPDRVRVGSGDARARACVHLALRTSCLLFHPHPLDSHPSLHASIHPSISLGYVLASLCNLSFSVFRRREPKTNLALAGKPVPRARQTETQRFTHLPGRHCLGGKGRCLTLCHLLPPSYAASGAFVAAAVPRSPGVIPLSRIVDPAFF